MPIPFLLAGLGVAAGVIGAGGHLSAKETNEEAQRRSEDAQKLYNNAKYALEQAQNKIEKALLKLGYEKKYVLETSIQQFLSSYDKIRHIELTESNAINEISKFTIEQQGAIELRQMTDIYSSSIKSGVTGAAAGAVVALAASGSLSVVTGTLATAGTALMAGEVGAAAGIAGSALSFGAAMTPLAAIAAPVILFTGISASMKADENLEKANVMYAEAEAASEEMKIKETLCEAITDKSEMFYDLLVNLNKMFSECSGLLAGVIKKKEGKIFKKKLTVSDFSEEERNLIAVTRALAGAVKSVIDTPIISKQGNINYDAENVCNNMLEALPDFSQNVKEVKMIDYNVKPINVKTVSSSSASKLTGTTVMGGARSVFAFILGFIIATAFAENIAISISNSNSNFIFLSSLTANKIALWLLICTSVTMLVGKFRETKVEKLCSFGASLSLTVLYVQYCRTVELMEHYILFTIIILILCGLLGSFLEGKKDKFQFGRFFYLEVSSLTYGSVMFFVYIIINKFSFLSAGISLASTSVLLLLVILSEIFKKD